MAGLLLLAATTPALGNIIITLAAADADGNAVADPVPAGTKVSVDISLSVDAANNPLLDLRSIGFDFRATTSTIVLSNFRWEFPAGVDATSYSQSVDLPQPGLTYRSQGRGGKSIIGLDTTPLHVAALDAIVNGSGSVDVRNPGAGANGGVSFQAGASQPVDFNLAAGNVTGGTLPMTVEGAPASDARNTGPRATGGLCGGSVAGATLLTGWGLACLRIGRCRSGARVGTEA